MIAKGAPFTTDWLGTSPLHLAAQYGHVGTCHRLLSAGISKDARTKVDKTALHVAAQEGQHEVMELLLKNRCDVDALDMLKMTPLHWAVEKGEISAVEMLLKFGASVDIESKFDKTPLEIASDNGRADIFEMLQNADSYRLVQKPYVTDEATVAATNSIVEHDKEDNKEAVKYLADRGIKILPEEQIESPIQKTMRQGSFTLTEAGKQVLSNVKIQRVSSAATVVTKPKIAISTAKPPTNSIKLAAPVASQLIGNKTRIIRLSRDQFQRFGAGLASQTSTASTSTASSSSSTPSVTGIGGKKILKVIKVNNTTTPTKILSNSSSSPAVINIVGSTATPTVTTMTTSPSKAGTSTSNPQELQDTMKKEMEDFKEKLQREFKEQLQKEREEKAELEKELASLRKKVSKD